MLAAHLLVNVAVGWKTRAESVDKCLSEGCLYSAITTLCECQAGDEI